MNTIGLSMWLVAAVTAGTQAYAGPDMNMDGWGMGFGGIGMILFWVLIIVGIGMLTKWLADEPRGSDAPHAKTLGDRRENIEAVERNQPDRHRTSHGR